MFRRISFIVVVLLTTFLSADQFDGKMILRVNGHDHYLPDVIGEYFVDTYLQQKDSLENLMVGEETGGTTIKSVTLGDRIMIKIAEVSVKERLVDFEWGE